MTPEEAFKILKAEPYMPLSEVRRYYIDLMAIWHPDRFIHNERLYEKANKETSIINQAYSVLQKYYNTTNLNIKTEKYEQNRDDELKTIIECKNCGTKNRIPSEKLINNTIKCGKCGSYIINNNKKSTRDELDEIFEKIYKEKVYDELNKYKQENFKNKSNQQKYNEKRSTEEQHPEKENLFNEKIKSNEPKEPQKTRFFKKIGPRVVISTIFALSLFIISISLISNYNEKNNKTTENQIKNSNHSNVNKNLEKYLIEGDSNNKAQAISNGTVRLFANKDLISPLEITTSQEANYFLKLIDVNNKKNIMDIFLIGGTTTTINVPLGTYEIKWASGSSWMGYDELFGDETSYSVADHLFNFKLTENGVSGYSIILRQIRDGNLRTKKISKNQF